MKKDRNRELEMVSNAEPAHGAIKRQRIGSNSNRIPASILLPRRSLMEEGNKSGAFVFGDASTADVVLHLQKDEQYSLGLEQERSEDEGTDGSNQAVSVHTHVLTQCRYFDALLSERWQDRAQTSAREENVEKESNPIRINLSVVPGRRLTSYIATLKLLYTKDFVGTIHDVESAVSILPIAAQLLYDCCVSVCVRFLEAVSWTREEERQIVQLVSCLQLEESSPLLARLSPVKETAVVDMFNGLVYAATHSHQNGATVKAFVAQLLSGHASRDTVRQVLDEAFVHSLKTVKDSVEEYASPNVRGHHDEIEALQRQNLHTAVVNGRHLLWIIERMIELKVGESAVVEWSEQGAFTANLRRAFHDDTWRNIAPGLPALVIRCTCRLASAIANGSILASQQVTRHSNKHAHSCSESNPLSAKVILCIFLRCSGSFEVGPRLVAGASNFPRKSRPRQPKQTPSSGTGGRILEHHPHPPDGRLSKASATVPELCHSKSGRVPAPCERFRHLVLQGNASACDDKGGVRRTPRISGLLTTILCEGFVHRRVEN